MDELTAELLRYQSTYRTPSHVLERKGFAVPNCPPEIEALWREAFDEYKRRSMAVSTRNPYVTRAVPEAIKGSKRDRVKAQDARAAAPEQTPLWRRGAR